MLCGTTNLKHFYAHVLDIFRQNSILPIELQSLYNKCILAACSTYIAIAT